MWPYFIVVVFWGCIVVLGLTVYRWNGRKEAEDEKQIKEVQDWAVQFVKQSMANTPGMLTAVAQNLIDQRGDINVDIDSCEWDGYPLWHGSPNNPNWFGGTKGITGYHVQCIAYVHGAEDSAMQFEWDVTDGRGITSFESGFYSAPEIP